MAEILLSTLLEWNPSSVTMDGEFTSVWSLKCICSLIFKVLSGLLWEDLLKYYIVIRIFAVQLLGHVQLFVTLCDFVDCSTPGFPVLSPRICSNSCPLSQWCHPTISSSVIRLSFCLQFFPASRSSNRII